MASMPSRRVLGAAASLLVVFLLASVADGAILSVSDVKKCYRRTDGSDCKERLVVLGHLGAESLETIMMDSVVAKNANHTDLKLAAPVEIRVEKRESYVYYKLEPLRLFNAKPTEAINYHHVGGCGADSCGYYTDDAGRVVPYSNGFCCECSKSELFGWAERDRRGDPKCSVADSAATSHCMRMSDRWFRGSRIAAERTHVYTLAITVVRAGEVLGELELTQGGTAGTLRRNIDGADVSVTASVIGAPVVAGPTGDSPIPSLKAGQVLLTATDGSDDMLQVPESSVTVDGRECDKIGVSFEAFYTQGERCFKDRGDCLHNQIEDILKGDRERVAAGVPARYLVEGNRGARRDDMIYSVVDTDYLMTVELSGGSVFFDIPVSTGAIVAVESPPFKVEGRASITVKNTGELRAAFTLALSLDTKASGVVIADASRDFEMDPQEERVFNFTIADAAATAAADTGRPAAATATTLIDVKLYDAEGIVTNATTFNATPLAYDYDRGSQGGGGVKRDKIDGNESGNNGSPLSFGYDGPCYMDPMCIMKWLAIILAVVLLAYLGYFFYKRGKCCCGRGSGDEEAADSGDGSKEKGGRGRNDPQIIIVPANDGVPNPIPGHLRRQGAADSPHLDDLMRIQKQIRALEQEQMELAMAKK